MVQIIGTEAALSLAAISEPALIRYHTYLQDHHLMADLILRISIGQIEMQALLLGRWLSSSSVDVRLYCEHAGSGSATECFAESQNGE
ncbi:MAG: hypothetical protein AAF587_05080 [Bacteroidota bacterium]